MEKDSVIIAAEEKSGMAHGREYAGITFSCTDGSEPVRPDYHALHGSEATSWLEEYPKKLSNPELHILATKIQPADVKNGFDIPFSQKCVETAIWGSSVYTHWSNTQSGGCFALFDYPVRLVLQTPNDGYPFISLAMSRTGHICKGIMTYDSSEFEPIQIMEGEPLFSGWRSDGLQIISLPQAILKTHSTWLSGKIANTLARLQEVEEVLAGPSVVDFSGLQRILHNCQDTMLGLERRSEFEAVIISTIEETVTKFGYDRHGPWTALSPAKAAVRLRRADLDIIPRRIQSARMAINDRILQQAQAQGLEIAHATQRIAEATMNDSASMRTIAILTMIFLPGTAVASFFSMTMFQWDADAGSALVSSWLWLYFVVATPLTLAVVGAWYYWMRRRTRELSAESFSFVTRPAPSYRDRSPV